jgi:hypothetical protein
MQNLKCQSYISCPNEQQKDGEDVKFRIRERNRAAVKVESPWLQN